MADKTAGQKAQENRDRVNAEAERNRRRVESNRRPSRVAGGGFLPPTN
jgi:hypothetical protein